MAKHKYLQYNEVSPDLRDSLDFENQEIRDNGSCRGPFIRRTCLDCGDRKWLYAGYVRHLVGSNGFTGLCHSCKHAGARSPAWLGRFRIPQGYIWRHRDTFTPEELEILTPMWPSYPYIREHRAVLALKLGRPH